MLTNKVIATAPIGQAPQALTYVPDAVPSGPGTRNLEPLGVAGQVAHLALAATANLSGTAPTSVSLFDQGLIQVPEAAVSGLAPKTSYILALAENPDGTARCSRCSRLRRTRRARRSLTRWVPFDNS
jgi:hypothetical protein